MVRFFAAYPCSSASSPGRYLAISGPVQVTPNNSFKPTPLRGTA